MERYSDLEHAQDFLGFPVRGRSIALVDDVIDTGKSVRYIQDQLIKNGAEKVTTAVLCWYKGNGDFGRLVARYSSYPPGPLLSLVLQQPTLQ